MKAKKVSAMLLATAMATTALAGCGGDDKPTATKAPEATENTSNTDGTSDGDTTSGDASTADEEAITTTLTVWSPAEDQSADQGEWLQTMAEAFKAEHPNWNITFEYGVCPEGDAKKNVTQDVQAAADVYMFANDNISDLVAAEGLAEIGGETAEYVKSTNSSTIVDSVTVDGAIYGIPFTTNTWFMYYDKSKFTEEDIKSLDAMIAKDVVSFPLKNTWYFASFYVANGCTFFEDSYNEAAGIDFSGEKATQVTDYLVDLVANKNFILDDGGAGMAALREGKAAALFSGSWDYNTVKEILGENMGVASLPTVAINGEAKQMKAFAGSKAIGVNPNAEYPQVAVAFAKFLASPEAQQKHYELRAVVPCNTELLSQEPIVSDALVLAQNDTFENTSIIQPYVKKMSNYWTASDAMAPAIINGEVTHDNAAKKTEAYNEALNTDVVE